MKLKLCLFFAFLIIVGGSISYVNSIFYNQETRTCLVTGKESVRTDASHEYRVYTDCGTYVVKDNYTLLRFDSADLYGSIAPNTKYDIYSGGYRAAFFSKFPNIISVSKTQTNKTE